MDKDKSLDRTDTSETLETLREIADRLRTQDNRFTKDPIFQVRGLRRIYGMDPDYCDDPVWVDTEEWFEVDPPKDEDNPGDFLLKTGYIDVWEVLAVFFTEEGCNEHLNLMGHRYSQYREIDIYVDSLYRCPEMLAIRKALLSLPPLPETTSEVAPGQRCYNEGVVVSG